VAIGTAGLAVLGAVGLAAAAAAGGGDDEAEDEDTDDTTDIVGTWGNDILRDGAGSDTLAGGDGADIIHLVENGTSIPYSRDVVRIQTAESSHWAVTRPNAYGHKFDEITGFDITSGTASNHDVLDLPSAVIAGNTAGFVNGTDVGGIKSHSISGGIVTFGSSDSGTPITVNKTNLEHALEYLRANLKAPGTTVAFREDTDNNGTVDSLVVFQDGGTLPLRGNLEVPDLVVLLKHLAGVESATLGKSAGANVVQIQDKQPPMPAAFALTDKGVTITSRRRPSSPKRSQASR